MRVLIQRVIEAHVKVQDEIVGEIEKGLLLFLGIHKEDHEESISYFVEKVTSLRIFEDEEGKMNRSVQDVGGELLVVSQFTLYGDCKGGRRPSFVEAMPSSLALPLYESFIKKCQEVMGEEKVKTGSFGAQMAVHLINDGPATFLIP
ncbi:MAG: D-tyrosyl-tRNA(Tyr) deacylase [Chlamydiia bacterium]|nr:D-tyrosyl-tRNA(Tyr) deacylase [Chlamydiia bacterium]